MAPSSVLYFPSIEFRSVEWLKLALLLWDRIYRIVPPSYTPQDSYEVRVAVDAGLIVNHNPTRENMAGIAIEYEAFLSSLRDPLPDCIVEIFRSSAFTPKKSMIACTPYSNSWP